MEGRSRAFVDYVTNSLHPSLHHRLNERISDKDAMKIAQAMTDWEIKLAIPLDLTRQEISDLNNEKKPQIQRRNVMFAWQDKKKAQATYGNLLACCLEGDDGPTADKICKVLAEGQPANPPPSAQNASPPQNPSPPQNAATRTELEDHHYGSLVEQLVPLAPKWEGIALGIGFKSSEIDGIKANFMVMMGGPPSCLREVLTVWMRWGPGDARGTKDVATLEALKAALRKIDCGKEANKLTLPEQ